jgi:hypothetical protein
MRPIAFLCGGVALLGVLYLFVLPIVYGYFPEYFGHYRFYTTCKRLSPGMTLDEARTAMAPFLEAGRTWWPPKKHYAGLLIPAIIAAEKAPDDHSILFIPDARNSNDWCIVYPENEKIVRVDFSPD